MSNSREVAKEALGLLQSALEESEARVAELSAELRRKRPTKRGLEKRLEVLQHKLEKSEETRDHWKTESGHLEDLVENADAKVTQLKAKLDVAESGPDKLTKKEINYWRARAESIDEETAEYKERIKSLRQDISVRYEQLIEARTALSAHETSASTAEEHAEALNAATSQTEAYRQEIDALTAAQTQSDVERATTKVELDAALREQDQAQARVTQADGDAKKAAKAERVQTDRAAKALNKRLQHRNEQLKQQTAQRALLEADNARLKQELKEKKESAEDLSDAKKAATAERAQNDRSAEALKKQLQDREEQFQQQTAERASLKKESARLQKELKAEKESVENLSEVANERLEQLTKTREQVEEAEERHGEAEWRLGKAQHFERLVERRKGVTSALIAALRTKSKANEALKAGVDSLRTNKSSAQEAQQKLLAQIEQLTLDLGTAKETIKAAKKTIKAAKKTPPPKEDTASRKRVAELEDRVATQAELIKTLGLEVGVAQEAIEVAKEATPAETEDAESLARVSELEARVTSQIELIKSLEDDLQMARVVQLDLTNKTTEVRTEAHNEMTQQQKLSDKLLAASKDDQEKSRLIIDALEREIAELRGKLADWPPGNSAGPVDPEAAADASGKAKDNSKELMAKLKQSALKIRKLTEVANAWKRKYDFLSADAPEAYQTQAAAEE